MTQQMYYLKAKFETKVQAAGAANGISILLLDMAIMLEKAKVARAMPILTVEEARLFGKRLQGMHTWSYDLMGLGDSEPELDLSHLTKYLHGPSQAEPMVIRVDTELRLSGMVDRANCWSKLALAVSRLPGCTDVLWKPADQLDIWDLI